MSQDTPLTPVSPPSAAPLTRGEEIQVRENAGNGNYPQRSVPAWERPVHGGIKPAELRALGLNPEDVLDFSASISPLGPPEGLWHALQQVDLTAYPDPGCLDLREALCRHLQQKTDHAVRVDHLLVGNGSTELIHMLARGYLAPMDSVLLFTPTYGEYNGASSLAGASIHCIVADRSHGFSWDMMVAKEVIGRERPSLVFLCNPNNPTGVYLQRVQVEDLARNVADAGGLLILDEAYLNFVDDPWDSVPLLEYGNVVLLRSMTKDYALTALRLGYSLASSEVTARLAALQPDWSVNGLAQAAGLLALADAEYLPRARAAVNGAKDYLASELEAFGFRVLPSTANFLLIEVGDAVAVADNLKGRGLFVRDCASFGMPDCIRVGIRPMDDCQRLVDGMRIVVGVVESASK